MNISTDMSMVGVGGIVGIRVGVSWLLGGIINFLVLTPLLVHYGILPAEGVTIDKLGYRGIVAWTMWPGVAMITMAALYPFVTKADLVRSAVAALRRDKAREADILKDIELPMWVFWVGIPIVGAVVVALGNWFFGISVAMGVGAILLIGVFTLIAVNSTALTSFTPSSALAKLSQVYAAVCSPGNMGVNLATGSITAEVTGNASNLLMDIKAGYLLGAKPRQQAIAHVLGAIAGAWAATSVFYYLMNGDIAKLGSDAMPLPGAVIWLGLAKALNQGLSAIPLSARWAAIAGILVAIVIEWANARSVAKVKRPFPISAIGLSLGFIVPFYYSATIAFGAILFWIGGKLAVEGGGWRGLLDRVIVRDDGGMMLASGLVAGAGIMGIIILCMG